MILGDGTPVCNEVQIIVVKHQEGTTTKGAWGVYATDGNSIVKTFICDALTKAEAEDAAADWNAGNF